jgi:hypothetical protein
MKPIMNHKMSGGKAKSGAFSAKWTYKRGPAKHEEMLLAGACVEGGSCMESEIN